MVDLTKVGTLKPNKELFLGYVLLSPVKKGLIEQKIVLTLQGAKTNRIFTVDIPIIGMVHTQANIFIS